MSPLVKGDLGPGLSPDCRFIMDGMWCIGSEVGIRSRWRRKKPDLKVWIGCLQ